MVQPPPKVCVTTPGGPRFIPGATPFKTDFDIDGIDSGLEEPEDVIFRGDELLTDIISPPNTYMANGADGTTTYFLTFRRNPGGNEVSMDIRYVLASGRQGLIQLNPKPLNLGPPYVWTGNDYVPGDFSGDANATVDANV
jgi:hypothetical protein